MIAIWNETISKNENVCTINNNDDNDDWLERLFTGKGIKKKDVAKKNYLIQVEKDF